MPRSLTKTSKFLSYVLRHKPESLSLSLDPQGWVNVDELVRAARRHGRSLDRRHLEQVVRQDQKTRFSFSEDGTRIRANYGHSVPVDLKLPAAEPPAHLYHGTAARFVGAIREQGLIAGSRQHVHLSPDGASARQVGSRHGRAVVLVVEAAAMHDDHYRFYQTESGIWLTNRVPSAYIRFPDEPSG